MKRAALVVVVIAAACGGSAKPQPAAPAAAKPAEEPAKADISSGLDDKSNDQAIVYGEAPATPPPPPKAAPAPPPQRIDLTPRLRDDGAVAGIDITLVRKPDKNRCGGVAVTVQRGKKPVPAADAAFADMFAFEAPTGLSFDRDPAAQAKREASMKKFSAFVEELRKRGDAAMKAYANPAADPAAKATAAARLAQINDRAASLLLRMEMPVDVRSGEFVADKIEAFCDQINQVAEPYIANAEAMRARCAESPAQGWWSTYCKP